MKSFNERLKECVERGHMTPADLHWWFARPRATVDSWLKSQRSPRQRGAGIEAYKRLEILERAIRQKKGFPVPHQLSLTERPHHIEKLYHDNSAGISRKNSA